MVEAAGTDRHDGAASIDHPHSASADAFAAFTGKLTKLTLKLDRPQLTPEDEKRLMQESQRNNKASE